VIVTRIGMVSRSHQFPVAPIDAAGVASEGVLDLSPVEKPPNRPIAGR
jgi:hypothetical protein